MNYYHKMEEMNQRVNVEKYVFS